jgi:hypothetical protein
MARRHMRGWEVLPECGADLEKKDQEPTTARTGLTSTYIKSLTLDQAFDYLLWYAFMNSLVQLTPEIFVVQCARSD